MSLKEDSYKAAFEALKQCVGARAVLATKDIVDKVKDK